MVPDIPHTNYTVIKTKLSFVKAKSLLRKEASNTLYII